MAPNHPLIDVHVLESFRSLSHTTAVHDIPIIVPNIKASSVKKETNLFFYTIPLNVYTNSTALLRCINPLETLAFQLHIYLPTDIT